MEILTLENITIFNAYELKSLKTMKGQAPAFMIWIFNALLNAVCGILTTMVIRRNKALQTDTQTFLQMSNLAVSLASCSFATCAIVHLCNIYYGIPEAIYRYR